MTTKTGCHCGLTQVFYKCNEFYNADKTEQELIEARENLLSCGQKCIKNVIITILYEIIYEISNFL
jgi:NF-X1-type zinc finger protein NFXL1